MCLLHYIGGAFTHQPEELKSRVSTKTADLIKHAFADIDPAKLVDYHTHVAGIGVGTNGTFVNPRMLTWRHPVHKFRFKIYLSAGAVRDVERADQQLVERLARLGGHSERHRKD